MTDLTVKNSELNIGSELHAWCSELFPICRSITGAGVRETLQILFSKLDKLGRIYEVESGTKVLDWTIPDEWNIKNGWIKNENNEIIADFKVNNLHVMGYSEPIDKWVSLEELQQHIHSVENQPNAIPYVTSYYKRDWGFCLPYNVSRNLKPGKYHVKIDSELKPGVLNYGEIIIPGQTKKEIFLSTYVCHPSMANNELSGPVVTTAIARWLKSLGKNKYTYRIVYIPETIGSIAYLSRNLDILKKNVIAGFNITCIGDDRCYSYLPSRKGNSLSDRVAKHVLKQIDSNFIEYSWLDRGSDERQYCAPGVDLPIATIMRSAYGKYPEYHTSLDDLGFVTPTGLAGGYGAIKNALEALELNSVLEAKLLGEPQLGKRGLYPLMSKRGSADSVQKMMNLLTYADGSRDLIEIAEIINVSLEELSLISNQLIEHDLLKINHSK